MELLVEAWFRVRGSPREVVSALAEMSFDVTHQKKVVTLRVRKATQEESSHSPYPSVVFEATIRSNVPRNARSTLTALWTGNIPENLIGEPISPQRRHEHDSGGLRMQFTRDQLTASAADFFNATNKLLVSVVERAAGIHAWRCGLWAPPSVLRVGPSMEWSADGRTWQLAPPDTAVYIGRLPVLTIHCRNDIGRLLDNDQDREPIGHELVREAWGLRWDAPRSALVIAVAGLETGVKATLARLDSSWGDIFEREDTPPVETILTTHLPRLVRPSEGSKVLMPSKETVDEIRKVVVIRNELVHRGQGDVELFRLERFLTSIRDVLWLCDVACGNAWALEFVSEEERRRLGVASPNNS
jgi:hypothetical protein